MAVKLYFAEFHISTLHSKEGDIIVRGPNFSSAIEAERNLHKLANKFMPDTDDEYLRYLCVCVSVQEIPPVDQPQPFSEWLNQDSNPDIFRDYDSDISLWTPR